MRVLRQNFQSVSKEDYTIKMYIQSIVVWFYARYRPDLLSDKNQDNGLSGIVLSVIQSHCFVCFFDFNSLGTSFTPDRFRCAEKLRRVTCLFSMFRYLLLEFLVGGG